MDRTNGNGAPARKGARVFRAAAGILAAAVVLSAAVALLATPAPEAMADSQADWGSEALAPAAERAFDSMPVPVANACGIGASSCFKCHNGTRAPAPKTDKSASPWHPHHKTVNDSCVGCHSGNARIIKKEIAHTGLVKDPRSAPEACGRCHKTGNTADLVKAYRVVAAGGK